MIFPKWLSFVEEVLDMSLLMPGMSVRFKHTSPLSQLKPPIKVKEC
jgi:hypothetical protein